MTFNTESSRRPRPGGRSARVRAAVLAATSELLEERGYDATEMRDVARRAGVHPTTVYRRWGSKAQLVGEALLERSRPLSPTPDTGALRTDMERLLLEGAALVRTPAVRALFEVLIDDARDPSSDVANARDQFWAAHLEEAHGIVARAIGRSELPPDTDPAALVDLVIGPALLRLLLMGRKLDQRDASAIVDRAIAALSRR